MFSKPIFYGWWIAITALVVNAILSAPSFGSAGLWIESLESEYGWSRTQLSIAFSLGQLEASIAAPLVGYLIDRFGGKRISMLGAFVAIFGFLSLSLTVPITDSRENWLDPGIFYISYIMIMTGSTLSGWIPMTVIINNWFNKNRSLAMSIGSIGFSVGTFLLVPLYAYLINPDLLGWRYTSILIAFMMPGVILLVAMIVKNNPEEVGLLPDGKVNNPDPLLTEKKNVLQNIKTSFKDTDFTIKEALLEKSFWLIALGHGASAMLTSTMMVHIILAFNDQGISLQVAATLWGLAMGIGGVSQLLGGILGDRYPKRHLVCVFGIIQSLGVWMGSYVNTVGLGLIFAFVYGLGFGARAPITTAMRGEYFGRTSFGKIMGVSTLPMMTMSIVTPVVAGRFYDSQGNYSDAFLYIAIAGALGSLFFPFAKKPIHPSQLNQSKITL